MSKEPVWFFAPTVSNYQQILENEHFVRHLISSVYVGIVSTLLTLFISSWAAYAIARMRFPGRGLMANTTLLVRMVPPAVLTVPIFALWGQWENIWFQSPWHTRFIEWVNQTALCMANGDLADAVCQIFADGLMDGRLGLILFYSALNLPFTVWLLVGFIQQIPVDLEEAAIVDGCTPFQVFRKIISPLMRGGYAVAAIFTFRIAWNEFILALILTGRLTYTLPVKTTLFMDEAGVRWGLIMAMGTLILLPPLILTFVSARQIIQGMTAGAVKG
ncbi:MAG: carbohydrate ABC transporter permease [Ardenticatenaceae bacterium]|nr:carbohydrate ABC transporter permease [Ardenticatenaceae bacterium]MCB9442598.1 carbohydrate ABC transporter permease [Ardenticatenaceae bacterium]